MFATTVDKILADFAKTIAKLEAHAEQKRAESDNHSIAAQSAITAAFKATNEANRAAAIVVKLNALIG